MLLTLLTREIQYLAAKELDDLRALCLVPKCCQYVCLS
jgi:hypothetical protein